jgi:hypothetical protein
MCSRVYNGQNRPREALPTENYPLAQQDDFTEGDLAHTIAADHAAHFDNALFPEERGACCLTKLSSEFLSALLLAG